MPYTQLLPWYDENKRVLPFRGTRDAYAVWISEIMLQQTRTETVSGYYTRFMERFPDVEALALADEQEVLKYWEGLGYYSRARNLHKAAKIVYQEYGGRFPHSHETVRALPGIGDYTAAAVCSIAYRLAYPAIDGNLTRVISRVHGIREDVGIPSVKRQIEELGKAHIDPDRPGDWNQALMDLGATICLPGTPDCARCPLKEKCDAFLQDDAELLPVRAAAKPPKPVPMGVALVTHNGKILVQQRDAALLKGLWVFLLLENDDTPDGLLKKLHGMGIEAALKSDLGEAKHVFSHRIWNMKIYHFEATEVRKKTGFRFVNSEELAALPLPTAMKAARKRAMELLNADIE
ncbi:MAG: A/G-specific adenine glycosylase [Clostridia bacterium]|nr:A/G-specific adenine glycosylase [Clostridia bacterium]